MQPLNVLNMCTLVMQLNILICILLAYCSIMVNICILEWRYRCVLDVMVWHWWIRWQCDSLSLSEISTRYGPPMYNIPITLILLLLPWVYGTFNLPLYYDNTLVPFTWQHTCLFCMTTHWSLLYDDNIHYLSYDNALVPFIWQHTCPF